MTSRFLSFAAALLLAATGSAFAATSAGSFADRTSPDTRAPFDAPPADVIISHAGMEWVWAAPCASMDPSCGAPTPMYGFDNPTDGQWASWASRADLLTAFTDVSGAPICASAYFGSGYSHCDLGRRDQRPHLACLCERHLRPVVLRRLRGEHDRNLLRARRA